MAAQISLVNTQVFLLLMIFIFNNTCQADALFGSEFEVDGHTILRDHQLPHVYYMVPPPPAIASDGQGNPAVFLSLTHYIGTELRNDVGKDRVNWSLLFELQRPVLAENERAKIIRSLKQIGSGDIPPILRDLPIRSVPTSVTYQPIDSTEEKLWLESPNIIEPDEALPVLSYVHNAYWTRRNLSFALSPDDGLVMRAAFDAGGSVMSISTHYVALGSEVDESDPVAPVYNRSEKAFAASAVRVQINPRSQPNYLRVVDLNSISPPGYVGLTVLCYDFNGNNGASDLTLKKVELEAEGATGRPIKTSLQFSKGENGISQRYAKFPFAVRVDRPYRYRTKSYGLSSGLRVSPWKTVENWVIPTDVSDYPEEPLIGIELESDAKVML